MTVTFLSKLLKSHDECIILEGAWVRGDAPKSSGVLWFADVGRVFEGGNEFGGYLLSDVRKLKRSLKGKDLAEVLAFEDIERFERDEGDMHPRQYVRIAGHERPTRYVGEQFTPASVCVGELDYVTSVRYEELRPHKGFIGDVVSGFPGFYLHDGRMYATNSHVMNVTHFPRVEGDEPVFIPREVFDIMDPRSSVRVYRAKDTRRGASPGDTLTVFRMVDDWVPTGLYFVDAGARTRRDPRRILRISHDLGEREPLAWFSAKLPSGVKLPKGEASLPVKVTLDNDAQSVRITARTSEGEEFVTLPAEVEVAPRSETVRWSFDFYVAPRYVKHLLKGKPVRVVDEYSPITVTNKSGFDPAEVHTVVMPCRR